MPRNRFADIEVGKVSNWRRVGHSTTNYFQSIDKSSFKPHSLGTASVNAVSNFASVTGGVGGSISIGMSAAAGGIAGAGFLASIAGPQVAVTAAVVGLALLIKGSYSNREAAHNEISKYVWSMIHDGPPLLLSMDNCASVADAATTLLDDGKNQIKLLGNKLSAAQLKCMAVNTKMTVLGTELLRLRDEKAAQATRAPLLGRAAGPDLATKIADVKAKAQALWEMEARPGGGIFEYARRCSHTANYLQAPHILAMAMRFKFDGALSAQTGTDYFLSSDRVREMRESFTKLDSLFTTLSSPEMP